MPWCPRCDEVFPEGPACPRCRTRLVERDDGESLPALPDFPSLKVSRRYRKAFARLSVRKPPSMRVLAVAVTTLVFAVGFLMGRVASVNPGGPGPTVGALPATRPLAFDTVNGSALYALATPEGLEMIATHDLYSGEISSRAWFASPFSPVVTTKTRLVSLQGSVALIVSNADESFVAFDPAIGEQHAWIPAQSAAWEAPDRLLVRQEDGSVVRWTISPKRVRTELVGRAERLLQTSSGAVIEKNGRLSELGSTAVLRLPKSAHVLAVSPDRQRAIIDRMHPKLWDGKTSVPVRVSSSYELLAASFEPGGANADRAALVLTRDGELTLALVDPSGNAALKPLETAVRGCAPMPVWDASGRWVYVNAGDGVLHAVEAGGGRIEVVHTRSLGCGLAWALVR